MENIFKKDIGNKVNEMKVLESYFGYIDIFDGLKIEGWAGSRKDEDINVNIYLKESHIGKTTPSLVRSDVQSIEEFKYCKGFSLEVELSTFMTYFKDNPLEEIVFTLYINNQNIEKEFAFSKEEWLKTLAKTYTKENFLQHLPLLGHGLERSLELTQLIDTLLDFESYKLTTVLISERSNLIREINSRNIEDETEREKLYWLLLDHHDILLEVSKELYLTSNLPLLSLVNQVLNTINHQDAYQIVSNVVGNKENIFNVEKLNQRIETDELIFYLLNHPEKIIETWRKFDVQERLDHAFPFMNIFVFLQEFDSMHILELSLSELNKLVSSDVRLTIETLQQHLFDNKMHWEGLLVTIYFISSGVKKKQLIALSKNLINHSNNFDYLNSAALEWLLVGKLFINNDIEHAEINTMMKKLRWVIDKKSLWNDTLIKKIYFEYINKLLVSGDPLFNEIYKLALNYYLLDDKFFIEKQFLTQQYLYGEHLTWVQSVEKSRRMAISSLDDLSKSEMLINQLDFIEYLSPEIVKKVKLKLYNNILNFESDKNKVTNAAHGLFKVGGVYDGLIASSKIADTTLYNYYESQLIDNTIKWQSKSENNYWYHQALLLRRSSELKRLGFLQELYMQILNNLKMSDEQVRLIRLFFSELLWSVEEGLNLEALSINGMNIDKLITKLININDAAVEYSQIFLYYMGLLNNQSLHRDLLLGETIDKNIDFETKDQLKSILKSILKVKENDKIKIDDAKKHIKQAMLYPYSLIMVYSCQAYISTRQKNIRETWLQRVKELGLDYVFVVGGSDKSKLQDDMMYLAVNDTYEQLPQKSVEMFRFAHEQFSHDHFMKIDDDCFVNVDAYFSDDVLFNTDYYGRLTERNVGDTNRVWHQKKSKTVEAKNTIDLSPEPSYYADGSTGYVLSRLACEQLIEAYNDKKNEQLVSSSFMEDKLVGDLLIGKGFSVNSVNFTSIVYRKMTENIDVTFWEYNLLPKKDNLVKILHCETKEVLQETWDTFSKSKTIMNQKRYFSNNLTDNFSSWGYNEQAFIEEVNVNYPELKSAKHIGLMVCKNELFHLPKLLEHHRSIGIEHFIYVDNGSDDGSIEFMLKQKDVSIFVTTQAYKNSRFGVNWMEAALANFCIGKWILVIDADELFIYDDFENKSIETLTSYADKNGFDSFLAPMVDMYNKTKLSEANLDNKLPYIVCNYFDDISTMSIQNKASYGPFSNSVVYSGGLRARIFGRYNEAPTYSYLNQKYCLFKYTPAHNFIEGIHFMENNNPAPIRATLLHFKYHSKFYDKVHDQILSGQHWNGSREYKRYLSKLEENDDLSLYDKKISIKYESSSSLIEAGYMDKIV